MADVKDYLKSQLCTKLPVPDKLFTGQTIIVTGSNVGYVCLLWPLILRDCRHRILETYRLENFSVSEQFGHWDFWNISPNPILIFL